jgi:hypothetical protein
MTFPIYAVSPLLDSQTSSPVFWDDTNAFADARNIPALAGTLVELELLLKRQPVDLESVTNLVRGDLGLTVQVLRTSRFETGNDELWRISDCVIHLEQRLLELTSPLRWSKESHHAYAEAEAFWMHAKLVATIAQTIATYLYELDVNPEQAFLSGLMHKIERLPQVLNFTGFKCEPCRIQDWVMDCNLPSFVNAVVETAHGDRTPSEMSNLSRVVSFSRRWIDLCLPWSETCMAQKKRFTLPVLKAANLFSMFFPDGDLSVPFIEALRDSTMNCLGEERPASTSVVRRPNSGICPVPSQFTVDTGSYSGSRSRLGLASD